MNEADLKHLRAAVTLAQERNFSRAASKLRISQSGLTKQISALEDNLGYPLFVRGSRFVTLTPAGEAFVREAILSIEHLHRAMHLSRSAVDHAEVVLDVGRSPDTDPYLLSKLLSVRLPMTPSLRGQLTSQLVTQLSHELLSGTLDLAFLTGLPDAPRLTSVVITEQKFYLVMLTSDPLAQFQEVQAAQLQASSCIAI
jgi:DNA-binding transcriptional LysR family regulator